MNHCPHVRRLARAAAKQGTLAVVSKNQLRCMPVLFAIDKGHALGEEEQVLTRNLRNMKTWVRRGHFALPSLKRVPPHPGCGK